MAYPTRCLVLLIEAVKHPSPSKNPIINHGLKALKKIKAV